MVRPSGQRLTVAVPLYRPASWLDVIQANVRRIPADARVVLSAQGSPGSLAELRRRLGDDDRVVYRVEREARGWREHVNTLIGECRTELFAILPQDDDIAPGYYERLMETLDREPRCGLAFGRVRSVGRPGIHLHAMASPPVPLGTREPWREALELDARWNLGIAWRGVVRRELLLPMVATPGDRFADQIWVFGIALVAHLAERRDAIYVKRYHGRNTHGAWRRLTPEERAEAKAAEIRRRLDEPAASEALAELASETATGPTET